MLYILYIFYLIVFLSFVTIISSTEKIKFAIITYCLCDKNGCAMYEKTNRIKDNYCKINGCDQIIYSMPAHIAKPGIEYIIWSHPFLSQYLSLIRLVFSYMTHPLLSHEQYVMTAILFILFAVRIVIQDKKTIKCKLYKI